MKKTNYALCFFMYFPFLLSAQDWAPIPQNERFNFMDDQMPATIYTIWVDSVTVEDQDSIFFLNRIAKIDAACQMDYNYQCPVDLDAGQFLQTSITKLANSSTYLFEGERSFRLEAGALPGDTWMFDEVTNTIATVLEITTSNIFGQADSVKVIQLSNGGSLRLHKHYGIESWEQVYPEESRTLIGLEEQELGTSIPNFWDYYDFNVGDVFQYYSNQSVVPGKPFWESNTDKYTILSKEIIGDSMYRYEARLVGQNIYNIGMPIYTQKLDTVLLEFVHSESHPADQYTGQFSQLGPEARLFYESYEETPEHGIVKCQLEEDGRVSKRFGGTYDYFQPIFLLDEINPDSATTCCMDMYWEVYEENCGMTDFNLFWFEVNASRILEGYVKNGDTIGTVTPDDFLLPTKEIVEELSSIQIGPNPVQHILNIRTNQDFLPEQMLRIYAADGRIVHQEKIGQLNTEITINTHAMETGLYYLQIGDYWIQSFIRQ